MDDGKPRSRTYGDQTIDDDDAVVPHAYRERVDRDIGRQRQGAARRDVEAGAVPGADGDPLAAVEVALAERAVVVRAPVLERVQLAVAVVDADREQRLGRDDPDRARRQLVERADLDLGQSSRR